MCIIVIAEDKKPDLAFLKRCELENPHGGGIAWLDKGKVYFAKNLTAQQIHDDVLPNVELPVVVHFRITSSGVTCPELCHPFPIGGSIKLKDHTAKGVIFHNGTWGQWGMEIVKHFPDVQALVDSADKWSDSRAIAWLIGRLGIGWLASAKISHGRVCLFTPDKLEMYGTWVTEEGFWLSHTMKPMTWEDECTLPATDRPYNQNQSRPSFYRKSKATGGNGPVTGWTERMNRMRGNKATTTDDTHIYLDEDESIEAEIHRFVNKQAKGWQ